MAEWIRFGNYMALLANIHRDPKKLPKPFTWTEFVPESLVDKPKPKQQTWMEQHAMFAAMVEEHKNVGKLVLGAPLQADQSG